ncbi:MAG: YafY family transcriptional regulator [Burkholderiaceae bacterium]|uniref:helix-turn-helix transcriptional regulator n=1 Tax=Herminiimonas sp. Marseille-P9896 TaxID=2742211 RepID=UPI00158974EE|nr:MULTISPECIES: YafY family protein [Oxalobacteraceae]MBX9800763.1 YafY family transcriptional regulator [Burkholderiaceae bacterium]
MRRAERLFQIAQYLRGRRLTTALQLSEWLYVSERTIYRDIRDLSLSGVPIEGEAGVGYRVKAGFDLQPLMFSSDEIEALVAGVRMVQAWGGPQLAASGAAALAKITLALPREKRDFVEATPLFAPDFHIDASHGERLENIRKAIGRQNKLLLNYIDAKQQASCRTIWPLALYFWGNTWSIAAWCETRSDFRSFRLDRVQTLADGGSYTGVSGRRLPDFVRAMKRQMDCN